MEQSMQGPAAGTQGTQMPPRAVITPEPSAPKKSKKKLWIGAGAVATVLVTVFFFGQSSLFTGNLGNLRNDEIKLPAGPQLGTVLKSQTTTGEASQPANTMPDLKQAANSSTANSADVAAAQERLLEINKADEFIATQITAEKVSGIQPATSRVTATNPTGTLVSGGEIADQTEDTSTSKPSEFDKYINEAIENNTQAQKHITTANQKITAASSDVNTINEYLKPTTTEGVHYEGTEVQAATIALEAATIALEAATKLFKESGAAWTTASKTTSLTEINTTQLNKVETALGETKEDIKNLNIRITSLETQFATARDELAKKATADAATVGATPAEETTPVIESFNRQAIGNRTGAGASNKIGGLITTNPVSNETLDIKSDEDTPPTKTGIIEVILVIDNKNEGTAKEEDFKLTLDGKSVTNKSATNDLQAGKHKVTISDIDNYKTAWGEGCEDGDITIEADGDAVCGIAVTYAPPVTDTGAGAGATDAAINNALKKSKVDIDAGNARGTSGLSNFNLGAGSADKLGVDANTAAAAQKAAEEKAKAEEEARIKAEEEAKIAAETKAAAEAKAKKDREEFVAACGVVHGKVEGNNCKFEGNEQQISQLAGTVADLQNKLAAAQAQGNNSSQIDSLNRLIAALTSQMSNMQSQLAAAGGNNQPIIINIPAQSVASSRQPATGSGSGASAGSAGTGSSGSGSGAGSGGNSGSGGSVQTVAVSADKVTKKIPAKTPEKAPAKEASKSKPKTQKPTGATSADGSEENVSDLAAQSGFTVIPNESANAGSQGSASFNAGAANSGAFNAAEVNNGAAVNAGASAAALAAAAKAADNAKKLHGSYIQGKTGPEALLYPVLISAANGLYYVYRKRKKH